MEQIINHLLLDILQDDVLDNPLLELMPLAQNNENALQLFNLVAEENDEPVRNDNYFEEVIPRYSPQDFYEHFRMSTEVMEMLIGSIGNRLHIQGRINLQKKILFTV